MNQLNQRVTFACREPISPAWCLCRPRRPLPPPVSGGRPVAR